MYSRVESDKCIPSFFAASSSPCKLIYCYRVKGGIRWGTAHTALAHRHTNPPPPPPPHTHTHRDTHKQPHDRPTYKRVCEDRYRGQTYQPYTEPLHEHQ